MTDIKSIWENQSSQGEIIIKTKIDEITPINCYAATNWITNQNLVIFSFSENTNFPSLNNYRFKGVDIFLVEDGKSSEISIYLLDEELKDIFALFIQNVFEELIVCNSENEVKDKLFSTIYKWKKLFDKINFNGLSKERQKGLIGELLFLNYLLNNEKTAENAVTFWTSVDQEMKSKDFTLGSIGVEIKFTSAKQPRILISNEKQLDSSSLSKLFLVLYSTEAVNDKGISLKSLVTQTRQNILTEEKRNEFNSKLKLNGYFDEHQDNYGQMYAVKRVFAFSIKAEFPKITKTQLPIGIYDISYAIEISAAESFIINIDDIISNF